jgi:hypothetical protein
MIEKPPIPGALSLAWPFIRRFTERVFAEDQMAVEAEQWAWDEQGEDWNHEVFPLIARPHQPRPVKIHARQYRQRCAKRIWPGSYLRVAVSATGGTRP